MHIKIKNNPIFPKTFIGFTLASVKLVVIVNIIIPRIDVYKRQS